MADSPGKKDRLRLHCRARATGEAGEKKQETRISECSPGLGLDMEVYINPWVLFSWKGPILQGRKALGFWKLHHRTLGPMPLPPLDIGSPCAPMGHRSTP